MAELLHALNSPWPRTNGERFTLVYAEPGQPTGFADFHPNYGLRTAQLALFRTFSYRLKPFHAGLSRHSMPLYRRSLEKSAEVSTLWGVRSESRRVVAPIADSRSSPERCTEDLLRSALDAHDAAGHPVFAEERTYSRF